MKDRITLRKDSTRAAQWRVMRVMRQFKVDDIALATGAKIPTVTEFIRNLKDAGMIKTDSKGHNKVWRLVKDFGVKPPVKRRHGMYDANSGVTYAFENWCEAIIADLRRHGLAQEA